MSHYNNRFYTIMQPVVLCLASSTVGVCRQNNVLKWYVALDLVQNEAAGSLRCIFPSQCSQRGGHQLHNEGYYWAVVPCWWWDFQPNVVSAAALCTSATSLFFQDSRSKYCAAKSHHLNADFSQTMPFSIRLYLSYFLKIPSTGDANCWYSLPFKFILTSFQLS